MSTVAMRTTTVRYQKKPPVVASIDFDNNNASILYNSITKSYVAASFPVSNISVVEDGKDISETAKIYVEVHGLSARIKGRGYDIPLSGGSSATLTTGKGGIISVTVNSVESTGYVLAKYIDSAGVTHTTKFNVSRSVGRYAVEIITTPTQISYNQTTGIASSSTITATLNVIDIYGNRTAGAQFDTFGKMEWRYVGDKWTRPTKQSITKLEITNPNFTKSGVEFRFIDGSGNQLDYETVPFSSVTNGGDAFLVNVASMNVAVVLTSISYGTPTGDVTNVVYMTKNNAVLSSGVEYNVPGDNGDEHTFASDSDTPIDISYNGWVFNYSYQEGRLKSSLVRVEENSPTSVHIPIDVIYPTDNITRTVMISYSAIQKGPAGRSYKPNTPELYDPKKEYVWNDEQRDFIYYAFTVNDEGEPDDNGALSYFMYGVKKYNNNRSVTKPPSAKGGDDNWEYVSEYKSIIVNCLFGTNAIIGGFRMTGGVQESVCTSEDEKIVYDENGNEIIENGEVVKETYQKPLIIIDGNEGVIEIFKKKAGIRIGLDGEGNPCLTGYNTEGKLVWKLGTQVVTNPTDNVNIQIPSGSTTASALVIGNTLTISVRGKWLVTNNSNNSILIKKDKLGGTFENPLSGELSVPGDISIESGETKEIIFKGSKSKTYDEGYLPPFEHFRIKVTAIYNRTPKAQSYVVAGAPKPQEPII